MPVFGHLSQKAAVYTPDSSTRPWVVGNHCGSAKRHDARAITLRLIPFPESQPSFQESRHVLDENPKYLSCEFEMPESVVD
jgi:hypothetical protein